MNAIWKQEIVISLAIHKVNSKRNLNSISQRIRETKEEISKINADIEKQKQIEKKEEFINRKL